MSGKNDGRFVITRPDRYTGRSVPLKGKFFDDLDAALAEAVRLNHQKRYAGTFLLVDYADAFRAKKPTRLTPAGRDALR